MMYPVLSLYIYDKSVVQQPVSDQLFTLMNILICSMEYLMNFQYFIHARHL